MKALIPYINFNGQTEEAFTFYKNIFNGEMISIQKYAEMTDNPALEKMTEDEKNKVMHASLEIGEGYALMATDSIASFGHPHAQGNNISLSIDTDSRQESNKIFKGLAENGTVEMPLEETFWGAYFGIVKDKFDIQWMINCDEK